MAAIVDIYFQKNYRDFVEFLLSFSHSLRYDSNLETLSCFWRSNSSCFDCFAINFV